MDRPVVGVVIPYFQREPGILAQTLLHVIETSTLQPDIVLVVNDGSPSPPDVEIQMIPEPWSHRLELLDQPNQGSATARNTGIDHIASRCDYIAFLDSDDFWQPDHLQTAVTALESGFDFYFADHIRDDWTESKYSKLGFIPTDHLLWESHSVLEGHTKLHTFDGDLVRAVLIDHLIQTSTVVYRPLAAPTVRFPRELPRSQDDYFWSQLAQAGCRVVFNADLGVFMGSGVNVSKPVKWATGASLDRHLHYLLFWRYMPDYISLSDEIAQRRDESIHNLRGNIALIILTRGLRFWTLPEMLWKVGRADWRSLLHLPRKVMALLSRTPPKPSEISDIE